MDYSIYTFGSGVEIGRILNSLAFLCSSESTFFNPIITMSASIGALWAAMNAIWGNDLGSFLKKYMAPSILLFNLMFLPKVNVWVVDHVDSLHKAEKVDNVPVGIAFVASAASNISYYLTDQIETALRPASTAAVGDGASYLKAGPMFAAHLMGASRDLVITDPTLRENVKAYVDQCFVWPYLYTNIGGHRDEALRTNNIYEFMKTNAHPGLGMYWKDGSGRSTFLTCNLVPTRLNMTTENNKALLRLAAQVLPGSGMKSEGDATRDISTLGSSAWDAIAKDSTSVHNRVEQQMLINAGRESIDDSLERFGSPRRYPRLISYSATRAEEQQNMGYLITGVMASRQMPQLQGVLFGLLLISFTVVVAYTFIPGSIKIWGMWIKMIIWVQSWPVFYAILNCIGLILLNKSSATIRLDYGDGISWLTQNGLADAAWSSYAIVQNLFLAIPFLSWAIISASSQGLVALADRALPMLGRALGQSIVDNTTSYDNQSMHNASALNTQLAQQTLGANINTGSTISDGKMAVTTDSGGGQTIQQNMSKIKYSVDLQNALQGQYTQQLGKEEQVMRSESQKFSESRTAAIESSRDFMEAYVESESQIEGKSQSENKDIRESVKQYLASTERNSNTQNLSDSKNWSFSADIGLNASTAAIGEPGKIGGGIGASAGVRTGGSTTATNESVDQHAREVSKGRDVSQDVASVLNASLSHQLNNTTSAEQRASNSFKAHYGEAKSHATELSAQQSKIDRLHEMGSLTESQGYSFNQAKTDEFLRFAAKAYGSDIVTVARKMEDDSSFAASSAKSFIEYHKEGILKSVETKVGPMNRSTLQKTYKGYSQEVNAHKVDINEGILEKAEQKGAEQNISTKKIQEFKESNKELANTIEHTVSKEKPDFAKIESAAHGIKAEIENEQQKLQEHFADKKSGVLAVRALKKIVSDE